MGSRVPGQAGGGAGEAVVGVCPAPWVPPPSPRPLGLSEEPGQSWGIVFRWRGSPGTQGFPPEWQPGATEPRRPGPGCGPVRGGLAVGPRQRPCPFWPPWLPCRHSCPVSPREALPVTLTSGAWPLSLRPPSGPRAARCPADRGWRRRREKAGGAAVTGTGWAWAIAQPRSRPSRLHRPRSHQRPPSAQPAQRRIAHIPGRPRSAAQEGELPQTAHTAARLPAT